MLLCGREPNNSLENNSTNNRGTLTFEEAEIKLVASQTHTEVQEQQQQQSLSVVVENVIFGCRYTEFMLEHVPLDALKCKKRRREKEILQT